MSQIRGADWKRLFQELMNETDEGKLRERASDLEEAIFLRHWDLNQPRTEGLVEREELREATASLLKVRVEKLGFPLEKRLVGKQAPEPSSGSAT